MNVYPEDLERALQGQPEVKDCVVVGLPQEGNARPCAVLILRDRGISPGPVVERANQLLAEYQRMRDYWLWPEEDFPRTPTQKPRKNLIEQAAVAHFELGSSPRNSFSSDSPAAGSLRALIAQVTGRTPAASSAGTDIDRDLDLSSLDRAELLSALEQRYQIDLNETQFSALNNLADLSRVLDGAGKSRVRYHYPEWTQRWPTRLIRMFVHYLLLRPAVFLLARPHIEGGEHLAYLRGPVLLISNHIDDVDVGLVLSALPAHLRHWVATAAGGEALEALRTPQGNLLLRTLRRVEWALGVALLNLFPLPRTAGFRESFAYAAESVERGYSILVFPEGQHTKDGKMLPFRPGIGLLATSLGIPIVPMRIDGLFQLKQAGKKIAPSDAVRIKIGIPLSCPPDQDPEWIASYLRHQVEGL
jgi:long-chain acyl-CoA synthetase